MNAPRIDPAVAAALDRFDVPAATSDFADRIAAATRDRTGTAGPARIARDRRGPWRRRAMLGGLALLLGTTAAAATLLDRVGIHLPAAVALFAPTPEKAPSPAVRHIAGRAVAKPGARAAPVAVAVAEAPPPAVAPRPLPPRLAAIRARLAAMPPAERRVIVREAIAHRLAQRAAARRDGIAAGAMPLRAPLADRLRRDPALFDRLLAARALLRERPSVRVALADRLAARAAEPALLAPPVGDLAMPPSPLRLADPDQPRPRAERLRALREVRAAHPRWRPLRRR